MDITAAHNIEQNKIEETEQNECICIYLLKVWCNKIHSVYVIIPTVILGSLKIFVSEVKTIPWNEDHSVKETEFK